MRRSCSSVHHVFHKSELKSVLFIHLLFPADRSSYPDRKEGEDADVDDEEPPDDKTLEYDDETLELTLPSGDGTLIDLLYAKLSDTCRNNISKPRVWKQPAAGFS